MNENCDLLRRSLFSWTLGFGLVRLYHLELFFVYGYKIKKRYEKALMVTKKTDHTHVKLFLLLKCTGFPLSLE